MQLHIDSGETVNITCSEPSKDVGNRKSAGAGSYSCTPFSEECHAQIGVGEA